MHCFGWVCGKIKYSFLIFVTFVAGINIAAMILLNLTDTQKATFVKSLIVARIPTEARDTKMTLNGQSYLMALSYHEQLSTAVKYELFSLATVAADWGLKLVEPFVVNSRIYGLKDEGIVPFVDRGGLKDTLPLGSVLSISNLIAKCSNVEMTPFRIFEANVPQRIIVIYAQTYYSHSAREINFNKDFHHLLRSKFRLSDDGIVDCTNIFLTHNMTKYVIEGVQRSLQYASKMPKVDKVICFDHTTPLMASEFQSYFSPDGKLNDTVVVFLNWRGCFIFDCSIESYNTWLQTDECSCPNGNNRPNENRYRLITRSALTNYKKCTEQPVPHPKEMIQTANKYLNMVNKSKPLIGIHLRTERLIMGNNVKWPKCFMSTLRPVISKLIEHHSIIASKLSKHLLVISDFNPRGSDTCRHNNCDVASQNILNWIYREWNIRPTVFQPELAGTSTNKGYVSLVEMTMLTNVDYLVLVGHGNFQEQLASHFLSVHRHPLALHWIGRDNTCTLLQNITHI